MPGVKPVLGCAGRAAEEIKDREVAVLVRRAGVAGGQIHDNGTRSAQHLAGNGQVYNLTVEGRRGYCRGGKGSSGWSLDDTCGAGGEQECRNACRPEERYGV